MDRAADKAAEVARLAWDYVAPEAGMRMAQAVCGLDDEGRERLPPVLELRTENGGRYRMGLRPRAHSHLAGRLGIPQRYYDRMRDESPLLLTQNVNEWLGRSDRSAMVRTIGGTARAVLSDRYSRIDNHLVLSAAAEALGNVGGQFSIRGVHCSDEALFLSVVFPRLEAEVKVGDPVQAGFYLKNSEVGSGALVVQPFVYRLECLNGMVVRQGVDAAGLRRRHVGQRQVGDEAGVIYADDTVRADAQAMALKVRDAIRHFADAAVWARTVDVLREAVRSQRIERPQAAVQQLGSLVGLTTPEQDEALVRLIRSGDYSKWGAANAVTGLAHSAPSYERNAELQELGGRVIAMSRREWRRVADAEPRKAA